MSKDPAFLFYYQDFLVGTTFLNFEETGAYIKILCHLADKGIITDVQIAMICDKDIDMAMRVMEKLECIKEGIYCSPRLNIEVEKRRAHSIKQRENILKRWNKSGNTTVLPLEDENENENRIVIKEEEFKKEVAKFKNYPASMLKEFGDYWTEPNKSNTKLRFELEKTWDLKRRLERWASNSTLKAPVNKKQSAETRLGKTMTQAEIIEYYKKNGKYPGK